MISIYDIKQAVSKMEEYGLSEDEKYIIDRATQKPIISVEEFTKEQRKKLHCDFESIYYEHATLEDVLRCRECGTVIFASDDEYNYDPNLHCPVCGGYHTDLKYWTKEDIEADIKKQNTLDWFAERMDWKRKNSERYEKTGLYFNELWKKDFCNHSKNKKFCAILECRNATDRDYRELSLEISIFEAEDDYYVWKKKYSAPLSIGAIKSKLAVRKYLKEKRNEGE